MSLSNPERRLANDLVQDIDRIVPVIGDRQYIWTDESGEAIPLQTFIVKSFFSPDQGLLSERNRQVSDEEIRQMSESGYFGLSLLQSRSSSFFAEDLLNLITDNIEHITVVPSLLRFLEAARPRVIITTSPFAILERLLPDYTSYYYRGEGDRDFPDHEKVIYHLFGEAAKYTDNWVYDETELLRFLHCLHDNDKSPTHLADYLKDRGTLFLGCDFPDWMFRFLWYSMSIKQVPQFRPKSTAGYWFGPDSEESSLDTSFDHFLREISYKSQENIEAILEDVANRLGAIAQNSSSPHNLPFDIFLSHSNENEDNELCFKIKDILEKEYGLRVWFDQHSPDKEDGKILHGDWYQKMCEGIENSRYFMPVVTSNYVMKFLMANLEDKEPGLIVETKLAVKHLKKRYDRQVYSLPVIHLGECVHNRFELNPENIDKKFIGEKLLPPELFHHIKFFLFGEDSPKDTFARHDWSIYKLNHSILSHER